MNNKIIMTVVCIQLIGCSYPVPPPDRISASVSELEEYSAKRKKAQLLRPQLLQPKVSMIINTLKSEASKADFDKVTAECVYQAASATVNTANSAGLQRYNDYETREFLRSSEEHNLRTLCIASKGYKYITSTEKKDVEAVKKQCPGYDVTGEYCVIPGIYK